MNEWNEVVSSDETVQAIVHDMLLRDRVIIGWNDGNGSLMDVLFTYDPTRVGSSSKLDPGPGKLFVSVMGYGAFGFGPGGYLAPGYFAEKMGVEPNVTWEELAKLVTDVRTALTTHVRVGR